MKDYKSLYGEHYTFKENAFDVPGFVQKIVVTMNDNLENAIVDKIIQEAKQEGITDLLILNKQAVMEALRKQIPQKVTHEATLYRCCTCPKCKNVVDKFEQFGETKVRVTYKHCHFCGQALEWSDAE